MGPCNVAGAYTADTGRPVLRARSPATAGRTGPAGRPGPGSGLGEWPRRGADRLRGLAARIWSGISCPRCHAPLAGEWWGRGDGRSVPIRLPRIGCDLAVLRGELFVERLALRPADGFRPLRARGEEPRGEWPRCRTSPGIRPKFQQARMGISIVEYDLRRIPFLVSGYIAINCSAFACSASASVTWWNGVWLGSADTMHVLRQRVPR